MTSIMTAFINSLEFCLVEAISASRQSIRHTMRSSLAPEQKSLTMMLSMVSLPCSKDAIRPSKSEEYLTECFLHGVKGDLEALELGFVS